MMYLFPRLRSIDLYSVYKMNIEVTQMKNVCIWRRVRVGRYQMGNQNANTIAKEKMSKGQTRIYTT